MLRLQGKAKIGVFLERLVRIIEEAVPLVVEITPYRSQAHDVIGSRHHADRAGRMPVSIFENLVLHHRQHRAARIRARLECDERHAIANCPAHEEDDVVVRLMVIGAELTPELLAESVLHELLLMQDKPCLHLVRCDGRQEHARTIIAAHGIHGFCVAHDTLTQIRRRLCRQDFLDGFCRLRLALLFPEDAAIRTDELEFI